MKRLGLVDFALIFTAMIWGVNVVIVKVALRAFDPIVFNSLRFILASALSWSLLKLTQPSAKPRKVDLFTLCYLGLLGHALYQVVFIYGINWTSAGNTSLLLATMPVWVALFSSLTAIDKVRPNTWIGLAFSIIGILFVVLGSGKAFGFARETLRGDILIVLGTLLYATFTIRSKPLMAHYTPLEVSTYTMTSGTLGLVFVATPTVLRANFSVVPLSAWAALAFSGTFAIVVGYYIWNSGVKILGPAKTAIYSNLSPVVAMLTGWAFLSETIGTRQMAGAAFIIGGLLIARHVPKTSTSVTQTQQL